MATDQGRIERFKAAVLRKESKAHRVAIDFGGGVIAQASTELMNWGFRALGKWSAGRILGQQCRSASGRSALRARHGPVLRRDDHAARAKGGGGSG